MTRRCPTDRCIIVREVPLPRRTLGMTRPWVRGHHFSTVYVDVAARPMSREKRLSVTCHEIGHALGLDHRGHSFSSCMTDGRAFPTRPDRHDMAELSAIYRAHYRE
jgi:predicted Zn-dependent protease